MTEGQEIEHDDGLRSDLATKSKARLSFPQTTPVPDLVGMWSIDLPNLDSPLLFSFALHRKPLKGHFVVFVAMLELGKKNKNPPQKTTTTEYSSSGTHIKPKCFLK